MEAQNANPNPTLFVSATVVQIKEDDGFNLYQAPWFTPGDVPDQSRGPSNGVRPAFPRPDPDFRLLLFYRTRPPQSRTAREAHWRRRHRGVGWYVRQCPEHR